MERIAELARLRLTGGECDRLTGELNEILALVDRLDDLPEQQQREGQREGRREREKAPEPQQSQEVPEPPEPRQSQQEAGPKLPDPLHRSIAELAPRSEESYFLVPKLPAHDDAGDSDG